ncbi:glutathione peroxidase [Acholeplasma granularum]|uniref:glutathione peroxidase n=1 Tax=Acholeplasma granularum TaxID=264635 RepID=UPI000471B664|nr:redoxin domain-containing protein [Acholeplasma granularum]
MSLYQIRVEDIDSNIVELSSYKGKVLLIVNTATTCFFTPQYEGLQDLYNKYKEKGFEILDFPSNNFKDAKGTIDEINEFCVKNYQTEFKRFKKVEVNGDDESILFTYLKRHEKGLFNQKIKWNFTKFLVDQNGKVIRRYAPMVKPEKIAKDIEKLLNNNK